jgi:hypothetical protein
MQPLHPATYNAQREATHHLASRAPAPNLPLQASAVPALSIHMLSRTAEIHKS